MTKRTTLALTLVLLGMIALLATHPSYRQTLLAWLPEDAPTGIVLLLLVLVSSRPTNEGRGESPSPRLYRSL